MILSKEKNTDFSEKFNKNQLEKNKDEQALKVDSWEQFKTENWFNMCN